MPETPAAGKYVQRFNDHVTAVEDVYLVSIPGHSVTVSPRGERAMSATVHMTHEQLRGLRDALGVVL